MLEVVTGPDLRSGKEAAAYAAELRRIMVLLGVLDSDMQARRARDLLLPNEQHGSDAEDVCRTLPCGATSMCLCVLKGSSA